MFQRQMACRNTVSVAVSRPEPQTATDLLAEAIPPPAPIVENLIHEGMLLLGGKSKRDKSWLMAGGAALVRGRVTRLEEKADIGDLTDLATPGPQQLTTPADTSPQPVSSGFVSPVRGSRLWFVAVLIIVH